MPTINENIAELQQKTENLIAAHDDIKNAIISKGGVVSAGDKFSDYPEDIETIKKDLTSISINENGTYRNGTLDTVTGTEYPIEIDANGSPIVSMTVDGKTVQDGTPTPTAPVDVVGVGIKSNNLFDKNDDTLLYYTSNLATTSKWSYGGVGVVIRIPCEADTEYTLSCNIDTSVWRISTCSLDDIPTAVLTQVDADDIQRSKPSNGVKTFTTNSVAKYILFQIASNVIEQARSIIMLNTGSTPLPYEPYGYKISISSNSATTPVYLGEVQTTRKIKKLVLTGQETFNYAPSGNINRFRMVLASNAAITDIVSTHYKYEFNNAYGNAFVNSALNTMTFCDDYSSETDFKAFLAQQYAAGTPVTVYYVLATPETTTSSEPLMKIGDYADQLTLTNSDITLPTVAGNNSVDYDLDLKPSSASISYYKLGVSKTITSDTLPIELESNGSNASLTLNGQSSQASTPTPTVPVDVNGVGEKTSNLYDLSKSQISYQYSATDGSVISASASFATSGLIEVEEDAYYLRCHDGVALGNSVCEYDSNKNFVRTVTPGIGVPFVIPNGVKYVGFNIYKADYSLDKYAFIKSDTPLPYEPYGYKISISSIGKNLFDKDSTQYSTVGYMKDDGTFSENNNYGVSGYIQLSPNTQYTVSDMNINGLYPAICFYTDNKTFISGIKYDGLTMLSFTTPINCKYVLISYLKSNINSIMLNEGSVPLPYEPYRTITPVYLGEVPTTRKIKKLVLTGAEDDWRTSGSGAVQIFNHTIGLYADLQPYAICNTFYQSNNAAGNNNSFDIVRSSGNGVIRFNNSGIATTVSDWKSYLVTQYAAGTPVTVWYVLATEETGVVNEPLMKIGDYADTLSTSIPITDTTNIIDVDTTVKPSSISITYNDLNTIGYDEINVDVPNTYTVSDEGKVVNSGTLVAQTAYPTEITANDTYDTTLYNSIVVNVPTGGSTGAKNDVTFYDYDGTIVTSYSKDEFANLSALPANPSHEGLTAQGWNWSLSDAKSYVTDNGSLNIGQMYVTDDGKTRIYITLTEGRISPILQLYLNANSELDIDWGDGGTHSTFTSTNVGYKNERHNYATPGDYVIAITVTTGSFVLRSSSTLVSSILWNGNNTASSPDSAYNNSIQKIEIGTGVTSIGTYAFDYCYSLTSITIPDSVTSIDESTFSTCYSLTSITIPDSVTSIGSYAFQNCFSLSSITIPNSVTSIGSNAFSTCYSLTSITIPNSASIGSYAFQNCRSLTSVTIPDSVTSISVQAFSNCYSLSSITIPDSVTSISGSTFFGCYSLSSVTIGNSVTSIGSSAFQNCSYMESIKFTSTPPPTVSSSSTWTNVPSTCIMLVPINTFAAYTSATNYPSSSTYTYLVFGTYESGESLPSSTTDNYILIWYASIADAKAETNPITTGNGNEIYARCLVDTSVTRSIDFDNNTSILSGDPSTHPIYTNIKRCTVQDNGTITSYYGDANYVEDGSIGQVMVYIPKFYYKVNIINKQLIDDTHPEYGYDIHEASYSVSNIKYPGYKLHPAFINANGDEVDYVLCSAFEGSTYDTSASAYNTNDAQTVDFTATTGDLLASIGYVDSSGTTVHVKPASGLTQNLTRPNSMTIAKNRGTGWYALTFKLTSAIQMLITVEYGCNSQVNIADGVVSITDNTSYNCASYVGSTVGNTTGRAASTINEINGTETTYTSATTTSVNWRGIENMWGNIWKWVDGINIYGNGSQRGGVPYVCTDMNFSDTNTANYESVGFTVANTDGYVKYFGWGNDKYDWVFMPSTAGSGGASASTTVGDYFYKTANLNGYRAARLGGIWGNSSSAGVFCWILAVAASGRSRAVGARLMYVPM